MVPSATHILQQVLDLMNSAGAAGLSSREYIDLMRDIEREAKHRRAREARASRPGRR